MENSTEIINELNKFLKGTNMGADTFEQYKEKAQSPELKNQLHHIIAIFKSHEEKTVALIQKLGGEPKDSLGIIGELSSMFEKVKDIFVDTDQEVLEHAIKAVIKETINEGKDIDMKEIAEEVFYQVPEAKVAYVSEIENQGIERPVQNSNRVKMPLRKTQKIKTDTGIEITIPLDYYNNKDYIEVINMPDGRLAIQIKNIGNIENK